MQRFLFQRGQPLLQVDLGSGFSFRAHRFVVVRERPFIKLDGLFQACEVVCNILAILIKSLPLVCLNNGESTSFPPP